ncbi:hypothetical protein STENM327S_01709 [Streptomyces tendae]
MPHSLDLLVVGDANPDVVVGFLDAPLRLRTARTTRPGRCPHARRLRRDHGVRAARLGLRVAFAGRVATTTRAATSATPSAPTGVDTGALLVDPRRPTPLTVVLTRGDDRAIVTAPGTLPATTAADVPAGLFTAARHVHAASYFLLPGLAAACPACCARRAPTGQRSVPRHQRRPRRPLGPGRAGRRTPARRLPAAQRGRGPAARRTRRPGPREVRRRARRPGTDGRRQERGRGRPVPRRADPVHHARHPGQARGHGGRR